MDACFPLMAMASVTSRQPQRPHVDFAAVQPSQWKIHDRLENWARWCRGSQRQTGTAGSPMFNLYRSSEAKRQYGEETSVPIDKLDAQAIAKGVAALPDKHRRAIHWSYLHPRSPTSQARELGVSLDGLAQLVQDGRQMLINRGV
jgi:DNA-directed RNA polymerase specialized sigma24 family protein